jgi:hypothetical protein
MCPDRVHSASREKAKPIGRPRDSGSRQQTDAGQTKTKAPNAGGKPSRAPVEQAKPASAK